MIDRALILGGGGIARRHAENLRALHPGVVFGLLRGADRPPLGREWDFARPRLFPTLEESLSWKPDLVLACGPASSRLEQVTPFLGVASRLYLEKPLSTGTSGIDAFFERALATETVVQVGYNLRRTEGFRTVLDALADPGLGTLQFISAEVGQYLPDWRPQVDYRQTVSARRESGGGALLELSHELDYTLATCGEVESASGFLGRRSGLDLDVEDTVKLIYRDRAGVLAGVHLDFCRRDPRRLCQWSLTEGTVVWNLLEGKVEGYRPGEGWKTLFHDANDIARSYARTLEELLQGTTRLTGENREQSLKVLSLIETIRG